MQLDWVIAVNPNVLIAALKSLGSIAWVAGALVLLVGLYTYAWNVVPGTVVEEGKVSHFVGGYNTTRATEGFVNYRALRYKYQVGGSTYESGLICICLPIGVASSEHAAAQIPVWVFPGHDRVSVMVPGPDYYLVLGLGFFGWAIRYLARLLERLVS